MKLKDLLLAGVLAMAGAGAIGSAANASTTYTFNSASPGPAGYAYAPDQSGQWYAPATPAVQSGVTFTGTSGLEANGSAFGFANAPGGQAAFIQYYAGAPAAPGSISLDIGALTAGQTYEVTVLDAGRPYGGASGFTASYGGTSYSLSPASVTAFGDNSFSFVAGASNQLVFTQNYSAIGDVTTAIDSVSVTAVPEPAAWALMIVGLGGLGLALRSHRRQVAAVA
jgi:hypothetical protein